MTDSQILDAINNRPELVSNPQVREWIRKMLAVGPIEVVAGCANALVDVVALQDVAPLREAYRRLVRHYGSAGAAPGVLAVLYVLAQAEGRPSEWVLDVVYNGAAL